MDQKTAEEMFKEAEDAKEEIVKAHEKKKAAEQEKMIEDFKKQLSLSRKQPVTKVKKDFKKIFDTARNYALNLLVECTCMPVEEICNMFSTDDFVIDPYHPSGTVQPKYQNRYWINNYYVYNRQPDQPDPNIIPLPYDMEKPKRKDRKTGKLVDQIFTIGRFYRDPEYLKICNDYFNKFNLDFYITNLPRKMKDGSERPSMKWKLELVINDKGFINLRPDFGVENLDSLDTDIQFVEDFVEEVEDEEDQV